jgi:cellulose synthase (UDP-forming)
MTASNPLFSSPWKGKGGEGALAALSVVVFLVLVVTLIQVPLDWQGQTILAGCLFLFALVLNRRSKAHWATLTLVGISVFLTSRYIWWRVTETLGIGDPRYHWYDFVPTFILLAAESYAWITLILGYIQTAWPLQRKPVPLTPDPQLWPDVDIYIPTYNEPLSVVRSTVIASLTIDWPEDKLHVYILDDGTRDEFRDFATQIGAGYITRIEHDHAKAGNLNHAMTLTNGEYIAIFDCDHIPARSFLQITMGWMERDPRIALLQTPHHFYSPDPFERNLELFRLVPNEGELFYGLIQDGNDLWDATFFCGSCAVLRRAALQEIGGIAVETVTEDAHTALKLQRRGWKTAYLNIPQAAGLATENLASHVGQRIRWARGMAQIFRVDNPLLGKGLNGWQRLCYLNAMAHFFFAFPRLVFLTAPLAYLLFGLRVLDAYAITFAAYSLPHLFLANLTNSRIQGRHRYSFWNEVYETALAPYILLPVWLAVLNPRLGKFNVTAKGGIIEQTHFDTHIAKPYMILWLVNIAGLVAAGLRLTLESAPDVSTIVMTSLWTLYNTVIISAAMAVAREARQVRNHVRVPVRLPAEIMTSAGSIKAVTQNVSDGGLRLAAQDMPTLAPGTAFTTRLYWDADGYTFPTKVVAQGQNFLSLAFDDLNLHEQAQLVSLLYTRADAWLGWGEGRADDRPLKSLLLVGKAALMGIGIMIRSLLPWSRKVVSAATAGLALTAMLVALSGPRAQAAGGAATSAIAAASAATASVNAAMPQNAIGTFSKSWTLTELGLPQGLHLTGISGLQTVYLNIPGNELVQSASVTVRFRYSPGLLSRISQINLVLNGSVIASWPVPKNGLPGAIQTFTVPVNPFLIETYNHIGFQLIGHYTMQCEDPANSTLWADILPQTHIQVAGTLLNLPDQLSLLPAPFYYRAGQGSVTVPFFVVYGTAAPHTLEAAGVIASWFGVLADYRPVRFPVSMNNLPKGNAVVFIDTSNGIPAALQDMNLPATNGPTIAVRSNPADPSAKLLLIMGENGKQLLMAAQALVLGHYATGGSTAEIENFALPAPRKADDAPRWLSTKHPTKLGAIAAKDSLQVQYAGDVNVPFRVAPDLFFWGIKDVPLHLRYTYNPGPIGNQSSLVLNMNNQFTGAVGLPGGKEKASGILQHDFAIPSTRIQPLDNTLNFFFGFQVAKKGPCQDTMPDTLRGAVLPDSDLDLSGVPHFTRLPNLALLANGGYPFTRYADLSHTAVVMPKTADDSAVATYLDLLGQFGAQTGYPALRITVVNPDNVTSVKDKNLIIMGMPSEQPLIHNWGGNLPLVVTGTGVHIQNLQGPFSRLTNYVPWWDRSPGSRTYGAGALGQFLAQGKAPAALMEEVISPLQANRVALFMVVENDQDWHLMTSTLLDGALRSKIFGNLSLFSTDDSSPRSFILPAPYMDVGHLPFWTWLFWRLNHAPWLIAGIIAAGTVALGVILTAWLRRRAKRRLRGDT